MPLGESPDTGTRAASMSVYAYIVSRGSVVADDPRLPADLDLAPAAVAAALADLLDLSLLRGGWSGGRRVLIPVSPEAAAATLVWPLGEEIQSRQAAIGRIQARLAAFRPPYEHSRTDARADTGVETLADAAELDGRLLLAEQQCRDQFASFGLDGPPALARALALARRGVRVRLLVHHAMRADLRARALIEALVGSGGEVRTTSRMPRRLLVFDAQTAFLLPEPADPAESPEPPAPPEPAEPPGAGVVIRHGPAVRLLLGVAESAWDTGHPCEPAAPDGYREITDDLRHTIIELLAEGLTDEVVARRLGISVRTCRRHIAQVLSSLDAVSRFQAGARATAAGLVRPGRPASPAAPAGPRRDRPASASVFSAS